LFHQLILSIYLILYQIIKIISKISFVALRHSQKSSGIFLEF